jgi:chemotaxis signal transduction protein
MKERAVERTQQVCSVRVGETLYGIPIAHVLEILGKPATQPVPLAPPFVGGLVHYRGEVLTAVSLRRLLGMPSRAWRLLCRPRPTQRHALWSSAYPREGRRRSRKFCPRCLDRFRCRC